MSVLIIKRNCEIHFDEKKIERKVMQPSLFTRSIYFFKNKLLKNYMYIVLPLRQEQQKSHNMLDFLFEQITTWAVYTGLLALLAMPRMGCDS